MERAGSRARITTVLVSAAAIAAAACGTADPGVCSPTDPACAPVDTTGTGGSNVMSVVTVLPNNGAIDIDYQANIVLRFSAPVDTQAAGQIRVGTLDGTLSYAGSLVTFDPVDALSPGTTYEVTATGVLGAGGEQMAAPFSSTFTTRAVSVAASASISAGEASFGDNVTLDSSGSAGTTSWRQIEGPGVGSLSGASPTFTAPSFMGRLSFELSATDGSDTATDTVSVTVFEDLTRALYVSPSGLAGNAGTRAAPLASIQEAIDAAASVGDGTDVYVAAGMYAESLTLADGVGVYGGFDPDSWTFDPATYRPVVEGGQTAVRAESMSGVRVSWMHIRAADAVANGGSSIAVSLVDAVDAVLRGNIIEAGAGMDGLAGTSPAGRTGRGGDGSDGGGHGSCSNATGGRGGGISGANGWNGGRGGDGGKGSGDSGSDGNDNGSGGGGGGSGDSDTSNAGRGGTGDDGPIGNAGAGGASFGTVDAGGYAPTNGGNGGNGGVGYGGGGGGGGYNNVFAPIACGGGGGGGGEGGIGGPGAGGGTGGGASIGVLLVGSTTALAVDNQIVTAAGGDGGFGGVGGRGQAGGHGGDGGSGDGDDRTAGGDGGTGGRGGPGGPGGGGGGGPSVGIVSGPGATLDAASVNSYSIGPAGSGGISGGTGISGTDGVEAETHIVG